MNPSFGSRSLKKVYNGRKDDIIELLIRSFEQYLMIQQKSNN